MYSLQDDYIALRQYQRHLLKEHAAYGKIQDPMLLEKFKKIQDKLEELKYVLSFEKNQLERERLQSQSLYSIHNNREIPTQRPPAYLPHESYSHPVPYSNQNLSPPIDWTHYVVTPNYEYEGYINDLPPKNLYSSFFGRNVNEMRSDPRTIGLYRGHLEDVEKMCNQELVNMESSIMNLRKIRRDWNCNELNAAIAPQKRKTKHVRHKKERHSKHYYYY